jgi:hypothetical protein
VDRSSQESGSQVRRAQADQKAEKAAGIGHTEQDHEAADRDADGRRPWELGGQGEGAEPEGEVHDPESEPPRLPGRDATGQRGNQLDLSG